MIPALLFYLLDSSSDESEGEVKLNEQIDRRRLRDQSNPLALPNATFVQKFGLNKEAFQYVLSKIPFYAHQSTAVSPVLQLAATLSLLSSGGYQQTIGNDYLIGMCQSTVSKIIQSVLTEIQDKLCAQHIKFNSVDNLSRCKEWFMEKYKIPGVIGCIAGTHIELQKPTENAQMFLNRKGSYSLNVMITCDHEYKITAINSRYGGAARDSFVWKKSDQRMYLKKQYNTKRNRNSWLLADSGYPLEPWCLTPYRNPQEATGEVKFNEAHTKARGMIEKTIGTLKGRWKFLGNEKRKRYSPEKMAMFTNVCAALHNICIKFKIPFHSQIAEATENAYESVGQIRVLKAIGQEIRNDIKRLMLK